MRCPTWREGIFVLIFKINKYVMSLFFPNHCSMCDWIFVYDHILMLIRFLFHISLYVVIMVWGRYNSFCRSLGARGARRGLKGCLDQPSFVKVWTILIYESCLYILAGLYASLFQPQYVDGLSNPNHKKLSSTIELVTLMGRALSVWGFSVFLRVFCKVLGPSYKLGTPFESIREPFLPS